MRLLVCGGRNYANYSRIGTLGYTRQSYEAERDVVYNAIADALGWVSTDDIATWLPPDGTRIIHGGAHGVDTCAGDWATVHWTACDVYAPDWRTYGRRAGPLRNQQMLDLGKPDKVLAIHGGPGTDDMVHRAHLARIPLIIVGQRQKAEGFGF